MITLRPVEPGDLEALYHIALATGLAGGDASHIHKDPKLIGHIYAGPYAVLAPDLALVAIDDEGVAGYIVGADDTPAWDDRLERDWWPGLRGRLQQPDYENRAHWSADERRIWMIFHPWRTPGEVHQNHRAHLHMNILPRLQRRGVGAKLLDAWLEAAAARGVEGVHIGVNRANAGGLAFWLARGFTEIDTARDLPGRTLWLARRCGPRVAFP